MFSYRRGTRDFIRHNSRTISAFCPTVVGQGFNTSHFHSESPMLRHRKTWEDILRENAEWDLCVRRQNWRDRELQARFPNRRVLPALNP